MRNIIDFLDHALWVTVYWICYVPLAIAQTMYLAITGALFDTEWRDE